MGDLALERGRTSVRRRQTRMASPIHRDRSVSQVQNTLRRLWIVALAAFTLTWTLYGASYFVALRHSSANRYECSITRGQFVLFSGPSDQPWTDFVRPQDLGWHVDSPWTFQPHRGYVYGPLGPLYTNSIGASGFGWMSVSLLLPCVLATFAVASLAILRRKAKPAGTCDGCGYSLSGLTCTNRCPECGRPW